MEKKKLLPIKIFQKRDSDERKTEGGGSKVLPKWLLEDEELRLRAELFLNELEIVKKSFEIAEGGAKSLPQVLHLDIRDEAIAKTHRKEIKKMFNVNGKSNLIGFSGDTKLLVKLDKVEDLNSVKENVSDYKKYKYALSALNELVKFVPNISVEEIVDEIDGLSYKVNLINYQSYELNKEVCKVFELMCKELSVDFIEVKYSPDLIVYKLKGLGRKEFVEIKSFIGLESFSFMPKYSISLDSLEGKSDLLVKEPVEGNNYPTIGVLDSGIADNKYLKPWLISKKFSSYPEEYVEKKHGTFVAGLIVYGDDLEKKKYTGLDGCMILDAIVYPNEEIEEDELILNIYDAINRNQDIKIWNLSLGTNVEASRDDFSDFGIALDSIQNEFDVLICKSVGNCKNFIQNAPVQRLSKSADSIRSLVVGSVAHKKGMYDLADTGHRSPFSRIGNGPAGIIKPEVCSFGGNVGLKNDGIVSQTGVKSFDVNGGVANAVGTSFSTPRVAALVAGINNEINETFNPLLLKALVVHSAKYPDRYESDIDSKLKEMGFGIPRTIDEIIYNSPNEVTLIQQDKLVRGEFFEILEFPYPEDLVNEEGFFYGEIKITLVTSSILNPKQGSEYCQSNIDVLFGTYDQIKERDISKPNILNEIGLEGNENVIKTTHYSKTAIKDSSKSFATERMLLNYGHKYQPIKKWVVKLGEMTESNKKKYLKAPKKWYLKLRGLYRDFSETMAEETGEELSQKFCLIITIKDEKNEKQVYDSVSNLLTSRGFNHSNVKIREQVRSRL